MVRSRKLLAFVAAGALVLAACGSDDDSGDSASDSTEAPGATEAPEATEGTEAPDTTEATEGTEAPDTTEGESASSGAEYVIDTEACDDPEAATAAIEALKIGTSIPLSGGPAVLFAPFGAGQQAFIDYYNAENGGIDGTPIELVIKDDQYTADLTKANVDELVFDDEVTMLSGVIGSPNNLAIQADMNAQCIPQLWASTGAPDWGNIDEYPWTTGLLVPYAIESRLWGDYVVSELGEGSTVALFYVNNEFGQAYAEAFSEIADENGIEIVAEETIDPADSGAPSGQMTNLVQANPDAILAVPLGAQCIAFMTELGNAKAANPDFDPAVYQTATCASPLFFQATTNGGADGVYSSTNVKFVDRPEYADDPAVQAYLEAMATYSPDTNSADLTALAGWLSMELAVHVAEQALAAGDFSRAGIMNAARNIDYVSELALPGGVGQMNAEDAYYPEATGLIQWSDAAAAFDQIGDIVDYNGTLGTYTP
jgi:branched-chain amino acid transport system substrate-binding protein